MIEIILKTVLVLYFLFGFISWLIGMKAFGGSKAYKEHLRRYTMYSNFFFYVVFICFIFIWPIFIKREWYDNAFTLLLFEWIFISLWPRYYDR